MAETNNGKCFFVDTEIYIRNKTTRRHKLVEVGKMFSKISKGDYNV
jgi:hypothetical protein